MIGIIGGSGLYAIEGLESAAWRRIATPFGEPSDEFYVGRLGDREVAFLPRHARGHRLLPSELNHRANIWAFKSLGARFLLSVSAVGSLREELRPLDIVLPDQFLDRTRRPVEHTFFGRGIVAHTGFGHPICRELQQLLHTATVETLAAAREGAPRAHLGGTYLNMEGPVFSTVAESKLYRSWGGDIIGMTNLPEAKLAREAEIAYATLAMVTDYDCWKEDEEHVTAGIIIRRLQQNAATAREILRRAIPRIQPDTRCTCHAALDAALVTDRKLWPPATVAELRPILARFLG